MLQERDLDYLADIRDSKTKTVIVDGDEATLDGSPFPVDVIRRLLVQTLVKVVDPSPGEDFAIDKYTISSTGRVVLANPDTQTHIFDAVS